MACAFDNILFISLTGKISYLYVMFSLMRNGFKVLIKDDVLAYAFTTMMSIHVHGERERERERICNMLIGF